MRPRSLLLGRKPGNDHPLPGLGSASGPSAPHPITHPIAHTEIKYAELPDIREVGLTRTKLVTAADLLVEMDALVVSRNTLDERIEEIKLELEALQSSVGAVGLRSDNLCFVAREMPGRKTLNKDLLMDNGVPKRIIDQSMRQGKAFIERTFKRL